MRRRDLLRVLLALSAASALLPLGSASVLAQEGTPIRRAARRADAAVRLAAGAERGPGRAVARIARKWISWRDNRDGFPVAAARRDRPGADPEQHRRAERGPAPPAALHLGHLGPRQRQRRRLGLHHRRLDDQDREARNGRVQPPDVPGPLLRAPRPADRAGGHEVRGEDASRRVPGQPPVKPNPQGAEGTWMRPGLGRAREVAGVLRARSLADPARLDHRRERAEPRARVGRRGRCGRLRAVPRSLPGRVRRRAALRRGERRPRHLEHAPRCRSCRMRWSSWTRWARRCPASSSACRPGPPTRTACRRGPGARYTHLAYEAELDRIGREMPVLITEAGHLETGDEQEIARFYAEAFRDWMADPKVVAATPLFWHPDRNDFWMFELDKRGAFVHKSPTYELLRKPAARGRIARVRRDAGEHRPDHPLRGGDGEASRPTKAPRMVRRPTSRKTNGGRSGSAERAAVGSRGAASGRADPGAAHREHRRPGCQFAGRAVSRGRVDRDLPDGAVVQAIGQESVVTEESWRHVRAPDGAVGWIIADLLAPAAD